MRYGSFPHLRRLLPALALPLVLLLAGCGMSGTNEGGFISGDGQVSSYPEAARGDQVQLAGDLLDGSAFDPASIAGKVTVVNVWGSWCSHCMIEAPFLQEAHEKLGDQVPFLGIDIRDTSAASAQAFEKSYGITYPSLYSYDSKVLLSFPRNRAPGSTPVTYVLDTKGRVAAMIRGQVPSALTLTETVQCVQNPSGQGC